MNGRFITFEGGEACGKSTQIELLKKALEAQGIAAHTTREPGGSATAERIRGSLLFGGLGDLDALSQVLLLSAARREHIVKTITPKLCEGTWVLCDRFMDSTLAYQGYGLNCDHTKIETIYSMIADGLTPDVTFVIDMPREISHERMILRGNLKDRYESMNEEFHERVRQGFLDIAHRNSHRCVIIDGSQSQEDVHSHIMSHLHHRGMVP